MKTKIIAAVSMVVLSSFSLFADKLDFQISYGKWSMSPFTTVIENESENLVRREFTSLTEEILPGPVFSAVLSDIDFSSSGAILSLALWYNFGKSRFSLGFKGQYFDFELPYSIFSQQAISFLNYSLVEMETSGQGTVNLSGMAISLLGRWAAFSSKKSRVFIYAGMKFYPYRGDITLDQSTRIQTPLGDINYDGSFGHTINQVRELGADIPTLIVSPSLGAQFQAAILKKTGLFLDISLSQGTFFSGGLFFSF